MKKLYSTPASNTFNIQTEGVIASSVIGEGPVKPSNGEYNGEFRSNQGGWSSENWSDTEK